MKRILSLLVLAGGLSPLFADDTTALQVAPSDTVIYPDASQILNKTDPAPPKAKAAPVATPTVAATPAATKAPVPTLKPVLASTPVPAVAASAPAAAPTAVSAWYLRWTYQGSEADARAWAASLGRTVDVQPGAEGQWFVWQGPLVPSSLKAALEGPGLKGSLVRK